MSASAVASRKNSPQKTASAASSRPASTINPEVKNFEAWKKYNLEKAERKKLTKQAIKDFKERFEAERSVQEKDRKQVDNLLELAKDPEKLKNSKERNDFFARLEIRASVMGTLIIKQNPKLLKEMKTRGPKAVFTELYAKKDTITVPHRGKTRKLNYQEVKTLEIALLAFNHHIPAVKKDSKKLTSELAKNIHAMDIASNIVSDQAQGKKPKPPKNASKEDKKLHKKIYKLYQKQHPVTKGIILSVALTGAVGALSWGINRLFGRRAPHYNKNHHLKAPKAPSPKAAPSTPIGKPTPSTLDTAWKWGKRGFWSSLVLGGGTFISGLILKTSVGEAAVKKMFGIKDVNKNRLTKGIILLSEFKIAQAFRVFKDGADPKPELHKRVAEKLGLKNEGVFLWQLSNLKYTDFQKKDDDKSRIAAALGIFGKMINIVPGLSQLITNKKILATEAKLRKVIAEKIKKLKIKVPANATMDEVFKLIDAKLHFGSEDDKSTQDRLNASQKLQNLEDKVSDETKRKNSAAAAENVTRNEKITAQEKQKLLGSSKELLSEVGQIEAALPTSWSNFKKSLSKMGFGLGPLAPSHKNSREKDDLMKARELLLGQFANYGLKADQNTFKLIKSEIYSFQTLVRELNPNQKITQAKLKKFKALKDKIFNNQKGYFKIIKDGLRNANSKSYADYKKRLEIGKVSVYGSAAVVYHGVAATFKFALGLNDKLEFQGCGTTIKNTALVIAGMAAAAPVAIPVASVALAAAGPTLTIPLMVAGAIRGDFHHEEMKDKGGRSKNYYRPIQVKSGQARVRGAWRYATAPYRPLIWTVKTYAKGVKKVFEVAKSVIQPLAQQYKSYRAKAIAAGAKPSEIPSQKAFIEYHGVFQRLMRGVGIVAAMLAIHQFSRAKDKKLAAIEIGVVFGSAILGGSGTAIASGAVVTAGASRIAGAAAGAKAGKVAGLIGAVVGGLLGGYLGGKYVNQVTRAIYTRLNINPSAGAGLDEISKTLSIFTYEPVFTLAGKYIGDWWNKGKASDKIGNFYSYMLASSTGYSLSGTYNYKVNSVLDWYERVNSAEEAVRAKIKKINKAKNLTPKTKKKKIAKLRFFLEQLDRQKPYKKSWQLREAFRYRQILEDSQKVVKAIISSKLPQSALDKANVTKGRLKAMLSDLQSMPYNDLVHFWRKHSELFDKVVPSDLRKRLWDNARTLRSMNEVFKRVNFDPMSLNQSQIKQGKIDILVHRLRNLEHMKQAKA